MIKKRNSWFPPTKLLGLQLSLRPGVKKKTYNPYMLQIRPCSLDSTPPMTGVRRGPQNSVCSWQDPYLTSFPLLSMAQPPLSCAWRWWELVLLHPLCSSITTNVRDSRAILHSPLSNPQASGIKNSWEGPGHIFKSTLAILMLYGKLSLLTHCCPVFFHPGSVLFVPPCYFQRLASLQIGTLSCSLTVPTASSEFYVWRSISGCRKQTSMEGILT